MFRILVTLLCEPLEFNFIVDISRQESIFLCDWWENIVFIRLSKTRRDDGLVVPHLVAALTSSGVSGCVHIVHCCRIISVCIS